MSGIDHHRACAITLGYNACTCPVTAPDPTAGERCRYVLHGPGDACDCKARLAQVTTHTRASTPVGPDYCAECSAAISEWVPWPCDPASTTAVAASTGTSEDVDRAAVDEILALFPMDEHGTGHIADCGFDANDERCDCYTLPERIATVLAAREAAARAEERERIAQAIEAERDLDPRTPFGLGLASAAQIAREAR